MVFCVIKGVSLPRYQLDSVAQVPLPVSVTHGGHSVALAGLLSSLTALILAVVRILNEGVVLFKLVFIDIS